MACFALDVSASMSSDTPPGPEPVSSDRYLETIPIGLERLDGKAVIGGGPCS